MWHRLLFGTLVIVAVALVLALSLSAAPDSASDAGGWLSPSVLAASKDGKTLYIGCATARKVARYDVAAARVTQFIDVPAEPTGLALSPDGAQLVVTCAAPAGSVAVVDLAANKVVKTFPVGHGTCAPVWCAPGPAPNPMLAVCSRFTNEVVALDPASGKEQWRLAVPRQPIAAAATPDGGTLVVANHLPAGPASADVVAAAVTLIDVPGRKVAATIDLPNGSTALRGAAVSPDGRFAAVTHILARYTVPTTQLERGWMNTNALSLIDIAQKKLHATILLDDVDAGAANPWGAAFSADGKTLVITHAGTHELSILDVPALLAKLAKPAQVATSDDLSFTVGVKKRVHTAGNGPRGVVIVDGKAFVAEYFSDTISQVDLASARRAGSSLLKPRPAMTVQRRGEMYFHDAALCFQGWQSCASCHPDTRVDGLNWDLLNDGIGNPKNTKSMFLAHQTPPAMSMGARDKAETAVRSGIRFIQFAVRPEEDAAAIDEYLKALPETPSPWLVNGKLSEGAERGRKVFEDAAVGCATCHPSGLLTNMKQYDVGTRGALDKPDDVFDTPTLREGWRTGPYLHDGSAATLREVLTTHNAKDRHGKTSHLTKQQLDDLVAYLMSL